MRVHYIGVIKCPLHPHWVSVHLSVLQFLSAEADTHPHTEGIFIVWLVIQMNAPLFIACYNAQWLICKFFCGSWHMRPPHIQRTIFILQSYKCFSMYDLLRWEMRIAKLVFCKKNCGSWHAHTTHTKSDIHGTVIQILLYVWLVTMRNAKLVFCKKLR